MMRFRILGPLEVWDGTASASVKAGKQRALLAILLLHAGRPLDRDWLVDALWNGLPPASAERLLPHYVWRLRGLLSGAGSDRLRSAATGYTLVAAPGDIDLERFNALVEDGRRAADDGDGDAAIGKLTAALGLWRGRALADARTLACVETAAQRLDQMRVEVTETLIETQLAHGRHADALAALEELTTTEPYRERPWQMLMLALERTGRRPAALAAYRRLWRVWNDELGIEPSRELHELHQRLLGVDPSLLSELGVRGSAGAAATDERDRPEATVTVRPAQLPPDLPDFTGRDEAVAELMRVLGGEDSQPAGRLRGVVVYGPGGIGKTALAVQAGHALRAAFPDGQLFVNLQGVQPRPLDPARVLAEFACALGVASSAIPDSRDERARLFRSVLADRRALVVLDNAVDEAQIRPLLPAAGCAVVVTARRPLAGLEGFARLRLDLLRPGAATELLGKIAGAERVRTEAAAAGEIVRLCGRLPLAVRAAGARLSAKPHWPLARLATRLTDERRRLDELRAGDLEVRASLASSHAGLDADERAALYAAARIPAADFAAWPIAALCDVDDATADDLVERLVDAQLAEPAGTDAAGQHRYRLHDLIRVFALEQLDVQVSEGSRAASPRGLLDSCIALAAQAVAATDDRVRGFDPAAVAPVQVRHAATLEAIERDPFAWYTAERATLVAAVDQANEQGLPDHVWQLAHALAMFFETRAAWDDWRHTHELALRAARATGQRAGEAAILSGLGRLELDRVRLEFAVEHLRLAADLDRGAGLDSLLAQTLQRLGQGYQHMGRRDEAAACARDALALAEPRGDTLVQVDALRCLAWNDHLGGRLAAAAKRFQRALALVSGTRSRQEQPWILADLGRVHRDAREIRDDHAESLTLRRLGITYSELGQHDEARVCLTDALVMARATGRTEAEGVILLDLGTAHVRAGLPDEAAPAFEQSIAIFRKFGLDQFRQRAEHELDLLGQRTA